MFFKKNKTQEKRLTYKDSFEEILQKKIDSLNGQCRAVIEFTGGEKIIIEKKSEKTKGIFY